MRRFLWRNNLSLRKKLIKVVEGFAKREKMKLIRSFLIEKKLKLHLDEKKFEPGRSNQHHL